MLASNSSPSSSLLCKFQQVNHPSSLLPDRSLLVCKMGLVQLISIEDMGLPPTPLQFTRWETEAETNSSSLGGLQRAGLKLGAASPRPRASQGCLDTGDIQPGMCFGKVCDTRRGRLLGQGVSKGQRAGGEKGGGFPSPGSQGQEGSRQGGGQQAAGPR